MNKLEQLARIIARLHHKRLINAQYRICQSCNKRKLKSDMYSPFWGLQWFCDKDCYANDWMDGQW